MDGIEGVNDGSHLTTPQLLAILASRGFSDLLQGSGLRFLASNASNLPSAEDCAHHNEITAEEELVAIIVTIICVVSASVASGLTQGYMALDTMELKIKSRSGTPSEKKMAARLLPIIKEHHLLLVSLMLWNATAMEALPVFLHKLVPDYVAIILSVTLILFVGEIIPAALLTGPNQLFLVNMCVPIVRITEFVLFPLAWPIAKVLDYILGRDDGLVIYNKTQLHAMVSIQHEESVKNAHSPGKAGDLVHLDEVALIGNALKFRSMAVGDVMTPIQSVYMLSTMEKLNYKILGEIFNAGYSRIPVYYGSDKNKIVGLILAKDLIFVDPEDEPPVANFVELFGRRPLEVWSDDTLGDTLKLFQERRSHLAIVKRVNDEGEGDPFYENVGILTMEDILEEILGSDIKDERDADKEDNITPKNRDMDFARLRLLNAKMMSEEKLTDAEIGAIVGNLVSSCPQIEQLFPKSNPSMSQWDAVANLIRNHSTIINLKRSSDNYLFPVNEDMLYRRGKMSNAALLILNGKVLVQAGKDGFKAELGSWSIIAADALVLPDGSYIPDFTASIASESLRGLRITLHTAMQRSKKEQKWGNNSKGAGSLVDQTPAAVEAQVNSSSVPSGDNGSNTVAFV